jgi:hypothetical protein
MFGTSPKHPFSQEWNDRLSTITLFWALQNK